MHKRYLLMLVVMIGTLLLPMAFVEAGSFLFGVHQIWVFVIGTYKMYASGRISWTFMRGNDDWLMYIALWVVIGVVLCMIIYLVSRSLISSKIAWIATLVTLIVQILLPISSIFLWTAYENPFFYIRYAIPIPIPSIIALIGLRLLSSSEPS